MEITLELHKKGVVTKADGNRFFITKKTLTFSQLMSNAEKEYSVTTDSNIEISLHFFRDKHLIKMETDDQVCTFFQIVEKDDKKRGVVQVHVENKRQKELRGMYSVLRPEPLDELPEQQFEKLDVVDVGKQEIKYDENGKVKGKFLITYYCDEDDEIKAGVKRDVELYKEIARSLGFSEENIEERKHPNDEVLLECFDTYKNGVPTGDDCFVFAFSGHGGIKDSEGKFIGEYIWLKDDTTVKIQELVGKLKDSKFPRKGPTIMLLSACRGSADERSNKFEDGDPYSEETTTTNMENIILAYSTIPNKCSLSGDEDGSDFTYNLYKTMKKYQHRPIEFHQLLTEVNRLVAQYDYKVKGEEKPVRQMPCFRSSLCKELYFK